MYNSMIFMNFTDMCIHHHKPVLEYFNYSVDNSYLLTVSSCFHPSPSECVCVCVHAKSLQLCPTLCNPMDCSPPGSSVHGDSLSKNTGVGCHALLQGIFPT